MWMLDNQTPYKSERTWVRDIHGVHQWIVVVKATYDIYKNGALILSENQVDPLFSPKYNGKDGESSIRYEADLIAMKPGTDVLLNGSAYAPEEAASTQVQVSLMFSDIRKDLVVYGDRMWQSGLIGPTPGNPSMFTSMPIVYERAYGGFDQTDPDPKKHKLDIRNPFGVGHVAKKSTLAGTLLPNVEYPGKSVSKAGPAGFGALPIYCSPRKEYLGTYDSAWKEHKAPLLPDDYDERCLLCSPLDQRPQGYLKGGEVFTLINLTPNGRLQFALPEVFLFFETHINGKTYDHRPELVTVVIEPDHPRLIMTWQTSLAVRRDVDYLDKTVITESTMEHDMDKENNLCCG